MIAFGLAPTRKGWRITYLGTDTPADSLVDAVGRLKPDLVVVTATTKRRLTPLMETLRDLGRTTAVAVGGAGAEGGLARLTLP